MIKKMEQILVETGELFTTASGISMLPCIRPKRDMIHLVTPNQGVKKHDVILYKRKNGNYILHRVIKTKPDRKSTRLNSSHSDRSRMPSSA